MVWTVYFEADNEALYGDAVYAIDAVQSCGAKVIWITPRMHAEWETPPRPKLALPSKEFMVATDVQVYFCDPQSPWQRGSNENTNLLLRQYFPRGTDLPPFSQAQLDQVSLRLNQRPRKTFRLPVACG